MVIEENPMGKRPSGRSRLRWEDRVERIEPGTNWRETADRNMWQRSSSSS